MEYASQTHYSRPRIHDEPPICYWVWSFFKKASVKRMDFGRLFIQCEMPGIENMHLSTGHVLSIGFSSCNQKRGIVTSPEDQHGRLMVAEPFFAKWDKPSDYSDNQKTNPSGCPPGPGDSRNNIRPSRCQD